MEMRLDHAKGPFDLRGVQLLNKFCMVGDRREIEAFNHTMPQMSDITSSQMRNVDQQGESRVEPPTGKTRV
jgi:hypothetical protein